MLKHPQRRHTGIQTKFLFGLGCILVFFSSLVAITIYSYQKQGLEDETLRKAQLVMTAMDASRQYVREILRPKMYELVDEDGFVLEAMSSSYISRQIMELVNDKVQDFTYRRVSINARNPNYEARGIEVEMISYFSENPLVTERHEILKDNDGRRVFMQFQPVTFSASCMHCHGAMEDAPAKIVENYGTKRGFNRHEGQVAGLVSVSLPIDLSLMRIKEFAFLIFSTVIPSLLGLYLVISLFFNRLVAQNIRQLLTAFQTSLKDEKGTALLEKSQTLDEMEELTGAVETIAEHLEKSHSTLEKYASELLQSKELLQSVFDGITDPVVLMESSSMRLKIVNQAFLNRYGLVLPDVIDTTLTSLSLESTCPIGFCTKEIASLGDTPSAKEVQLQGEDIYMVSFYPVRDENQKSGDVVCYVKDITEQRQMEMRIQHTEKLVSLGQLAAGVAHEINNPLGIILCHLDLIKDDPDLGDESSEDIRIIEKHVGSCRNIIADLLRFARQTKPSFEHAQINDVLEDVLSMTANQLKGQNIQVTQRLDPAIPPFLLEVDRIRQVILNLILNSLQAMEKGGELTILSQYDAATEETVVSVSDNGSGISPDVVDKIFEPFFTTKGPGKGTGLGLSVSYGIIREHLGDIRVESAPGHQTTFTITLPLRKEES